jgi:hypothetical protein
MFILCIIEIMQIRELGQVAALAHLFSLREPGLESEQKQVQKQKQAQE